MGRRVGADVFVIVLVGRSGFDLLAGAGLVRLERISYTSVVYESAGEILRAARHRLGITQADLAAAMDVNQQSVSRWESSRAIPRRQMALRLAHFMQMPDHDSFLRSCGHPVSELPEKAVRPLLPRLPLGSISPADFEGFCRDFVALRHSGSEVSRFGGEGHKQDGIDLLARFEGGSSATFQCKRRQTFGAARVAEAVKANAVEADRHYLLLSRVASPDARKEIRKHEGWVLWDVEDISRIVRFELSLDDARRLIDTYFPGYREHVLGLTAAGLWLTPEEYFRPVLKPNAVLSQRWLLVGRDSELDRLSKFMESKENALLVLGRGGAGKTRLLLGLVDLMREKRPDHPIRFAAREAVFRPEDLETLPREALVIVDDAHDRDDVDVLLAGLARRDDVKTVLGARPYALSKLIESLAAAGMISIDGPSRLELCDLEREHLEELAREVLEDAGADHEAASQIVDATLDSPLFTVVGSQLVASGKTDPSGLASDDTARSLLLATFRDAIVGDVGEPGDQVLLRELLRLIATLQPVNCDDESFRIAASEVLQRSPDVLIRHLRTLEEAGILIRRGRKMRVVPDLLADFLVADACIDPKTGSPTGYADRVFGASNGEVAQHLIINVAKLDWRITREHEIRSQLLDRIWGSLSEEILSLDAAGRASLLSAFPDISFYQPARALELAGDLIENPAERSQELLGSFTNEHALAEIPKFLRGAGYHLDYLGAVADLLWKLGRSRPARLHSEPHHSVRILAELAEFEPRKPLTYSEVVVERAIKWLDDPKVGEYAHSPFDVLEPALATEGYQTRSRGWTLQMQPYFINADVVRGLRHRVLGVAINALSHSDLRVGFRAAAFLEEGLRYPTGLFGRRAGEREQQPWKPEVLRLLEQIRQVLTSEPLDPVVKDRLLRAVSWDARHGDGPAQAAARKIVPLAGNDIPMRLTRALAHGWAHSAELPQEELDYAEVEEKWRGFQRQVAADLISDPAPGHIAAAVDLIEERLGALALVGEIDTNPGPFLDAFFNHAPQASEEVLRRIASDPEGPLCRQLHVALGSLLDVDPTKGLEFASELVKIGDSSRGVAAAYGWAARKRSFSEAELELINELCRHPDFQTRLSLARGLRFASSLEDTSNVDLLLRISIDGVSEIAEEIVGCFGRHGDFSVRDLSSGQRKRLLTDLSTCQDIDDYQIGLFLGDLSVIDPNAVIEFLVDRVRKTTGRREGKGYIPIPYLWEKSSPLRFRESNNFMGVIERLLVWTLDKGRSGPKSFWSPLIFKAVVGIFDDVILQALGEWLLDSDPSKIKAAAQLLRHAPAALVWENASWVRSVLENADSISSDCYSEVASAFHSAVISGTRRGTPGEPFPQDVEQRDKSAQIAASLPPGSPAHRFFVALKKSADESIRWSIEIDEEDRPR
ncbi:MAG: helix-turn-helix domain-containing protein [Actinomycetota bacterium]